MTAFPLHEIQKHQARLNDHAVYGRLRELDDLRVFMTHHVYSVWDFMSLIKYLQSKLAPDRFPWAPVGDPLVRRFINELVLEEESDQGVPDADTPEFISHFELYCHAMGEVGADPEPARRFADTAHARGLAAALDGGMAPAASAAFTRRTFQFIDGDRPHEVAAALALGREHIIPAMFRAFLDRMGLRETEAPAFHYYLNRHVHLDEDFHAPMSLRMVEHFIDGDPRRRDQAVTAAIDAIAARIAFWDGVMAQLPSETEARAEAGAR